MTIPRGHPPPSLLPAEFHNYVQVYEINDSYLPGYVYLELRYLLTQCVDDGKYNYVEVDEELNLPNRNDEDNVSNRHGPAVFMITAIYQDCPLMLYVACVVCCGRHKPLIGQHDTETTAGQTQQLLNVLSNHVVSADTINTFKNRLDKFWSDQEVLYDYNTDLHGIVNRSLL